MPKYIRDEHDAAMFEMRFKRKAKIYTLEETHDLWLRAKERSNKQNKVITDIINRIKTELPTLNNNKYAFFYENDKLRYYEFSDRYTFPSYSYSCNNYVEPKDKKEKRKFEIYKLLNPISFELGEMFHNALRHRSNKDYIVRHIMVEKIKQKLEELKLTYNTNIIKIEISGYHYDILVNRKDYNYTEYEFLGESAKTPIKLS